VLSAVRQNPKTRDQRERKESQVESRSKREGWRGSGIFPAGESRGRGEVEGALGRCGGGDDGEIQKVDHGPS